MLETLQRPMKALRVKEEKVSPAPAPALDASAPRGSALPLHAALPALNPSVEASLNSLQLPPAVTVQIPVARAAGGPWTPLPGQSLEGPRGPLNLTFGLSHECGRDPTAYAERDGVQQPISRETVEQLFSGLHPNFAIYIKYGLKIGAESANGEFFHTFVCTYVCTYVCALGWGRNGRAAQSHGARCPEPATPGYGGVPAAEPAAVPATATCAAVPAAAVPAADAGHEAVPEPAGQRLVASSEDSPFADALPSHQRPTGGTLLFPEQLGKETVFGAVV